MKIKGLPKDKWDKDVDVQIVNDMCPLLQSCDFCEYYNQKYSLCANGHVTCLDCEKKNITFNEQLFCRECSAYSYRITVPLELILSLDFRCGCGFLGTLEDVRTHVNSSDYDHGCEISKEAEDSDFQRVAAELKDLKEVFISLVRDVETRFERMKSVLQHFGLEILSREKLQQSKERLNRLIARTDRISERCSEIKGINDQLRPLVELLFERAIWCTFSIEQLLTEASTEKFLSINGSFVALRITINENGVGDVYVRITSAITTPEPGESLQQMLVLRWHDTCGYTIKEVALETNKAGNFDLNHYRDNFARLHNLHCYKKVPKFINLMSVLATSNLLTDWIYLSVQFYNI